jgi:hypothetical protein
MAFQVIVKNTISRTRRRRTARRSAESVTGSLRHARHFPIDREREPGFD